MEGISNTIFQEIAVSISIIMIFSLIILTISGVWPPFATIESGSMEPHLSKGDLVFLMDQHKDIPDSSYEKTGIVTYDQGNQTNYKTYGSNGDVIIYHPNGNTQVTPVIHRAMFWVEKGENWYDKTDKQYVGDASNCSELANCPAPNEGFITKGDANQSYDQATGISSPVNPNWIKGTAKLRIPWLGWIRLLLIGVQLHFFAQISG